MPGFVFRLERVLQLRQAAVEEHKRLLAELRKGIRALEARLSALEQEKASLNEQWRAASAKLSAEMAMSMAGFAEELERRTRAAATELAGARQAELARCALLQAAMRQQKILEKLRARALKRYQIDAGRHEQKELDEFTITSGKSRPQ